MRPNPVCLAFVLALVGGGLLALLLCLVNRLCGGGDRADLDNVVQGAVAVKPDMDKDDTEDQSLSSTSAPLSDGEFDEVQKPFVPLLIVAGLIMAFAHGGNDVGNSVGPLAVIINID